MAEILGSGVAFPLQVDRRGGIALASDETDVDQAIHLILSTAKGERPMRPDFGCGVHDFVFDTIDATTVAQMEGEVREALDHWEPRIEVVDVDFDLSGAARRRAADQHRLPHAVHEPPAQPGLSLLHHPRRGHRAVRLPDIQLDDRRFQDLVSEARLKINRACPEWTEHNVSDPGITLIELFAWMTEMTIYRLNRVPDKLHVALLDLLGIQLDGPTAARTSVRLRLAGVPEEPVEIAAGETEIATPRTPNEESIVFQVDEDFVIPAMRPSAYVVQRANQIKDVGLAEGIARPQGADQLPFGSPPAVGDALHLGFDEPLGRLLIQVDVDASQARGAGVNPEDPPLRWEVSQGDGTWAEAEVLEDLTGGFNYGSGTVELQLPERSAIQNLGGHRMHWLRCRIDDKTRHGGRRDDLLAPARDLLDLRGADRRAAALHPRVADRGRAARALRRHARPGVPAAPQPGAQAPARARRSRSRTPSRATGRPGSGARTSSPRPSSTATSCSTPSRASWSSGPRSARPTAAGPSTAPCRRRARCSASRGTATAAAGAATSRPARCRCCAPRSPASTPWSTRSPRAAAWTPRRSSTRASARRWRSARATAPSRRRTSSSSPARRRRASRARSASRPRTAGPCRCTSCRTSTRPTASSPTPSSSPSPS